MSAEAIAAGISVIASLMTIAVSWGYMKAQFQEFKLRLKEVEDEVKDHDDKFVTVRHFQDITRPLQEQISEIRQDIKTILVHVSSGANGSRRKDKFPADS